MERGAVVQPGERKGEVKKKILDLWAARDREGSESESEQSCSESRGEKQKSKARERKEGERDARSLAVFPVKS